MTHAERVDRAEILRGERLTVPPEDNALLAAARRYVAADISLIPVRVADKRPASALLPRNAARQATWAPFQQQIAVATTVERWYTTRNVVIAVVCGRVSQNLELLDFDHHPPEHPHLFAAWATLVEAQAPGLVARLVLAATQHGGIHALYRCSEIAGNQKLAQYWKLDPDTGKPQRETAIETRGEGGYALVAPAPGYAFTQGDLTQLPVITPEERAIMFAAARSLNATAEPVTGATLPASGGKRAASAPTSAELRPGDDYNARTPVAATADLLVKAGWESVFARNGVFYLRRPGKKGRAWSATLNFFPGKFYVFSSNAHPFDANRTYDPFGVYVLLEHGGDFTAATQALGSQGYGTPLEARRNGCSSIGQAQVSAPVGPTPATAAALAPAHAPAESGTAHPVPAAAPPGGESDLPAIVVTNRPPRDIVSQARRALETAPGVAALYRRGSNLVRLEAETVGQLRITTETPDTIAGRLIRAANFYRMTRDGPVHVPPPDYVPRDILAMDRAAWPLLKGITQMPIIRPDGSILDQPGYDQATGLFYAPEPAVQQLTVPESPTRQDLADASELLNEWLADFPFIDAASAAHALALPLTLVVRELIPDLVPAFVIDARAAGTGKGLFVETTGVIATGRLPELGTLPGSDQEIRKLLTAKLLTGARFIILDNIRGPVESAALEAVLTAQVWTDRELGRSYAPATEQRAVFVLNGNAIMLAGDLPRRCVWIRLDAMTDAPWQRQAFLHNPLGDWVRANRPRLLVALLTLIRGWVAAGQPPVAVPTLGSYENWSRVLGGILAFAGIEGFLQNLPRPSAAPTGEYAQWADCLAAWSAGLGAAAWTIEQLATALLNEVRGAEPSDTRFATLAGALPVALQEALQEAPADGGGAFRRRLGIALRSHAARPYAQLRLEQAGVDGHTQRPRWRVVPD